MRYSEELKESMYWLQHNEWWTPVGKNGIKFKEGCPERIKKSFEMYMERQRKK